MVLSALSTDAYLHLVQAARADEHVLGVVLTGSRASDALATEFSDWDVRLIVRDRALDDCRRKFGTIRGEPVEVVVFALADFERSGELDSDTAWDRYSYTHAKVVLDKLDGTITRLVADKATLPPMLARSIAEAALDGYINSYYRSLKNHAAGLEIASRLDAAESIGHLLDTLFAIYGRVRPYNKYLAWELGSFPLEEARWNAQSLLNRIGQIVSTGAPAEQRALFQSVAKVAREHCLEEVLEGWRADFPLLYGPPT